MNTNRMWILGAVAAMIVIALAGWFVGISPVVAQAAASDEQVASVTQANADSTAKLALLRQQYANIGPLQKSLDSLRKSIPVGADASAFLQELDDLSAQQGVVISSVTIASATIYTAPTSGATASSGAATDATSTPTPAPPVATTPVAPSPSTSGQFVQIPVQIVVVGDFDAVRNFIGAIQLGPRLYLATAVSITQSAGQTGSTGTLTGFIFTMQGTSDATKSKKPASTPTPTPTPVPTGTPTPSPTMTSIPIPIPTPTPTLTPTP
jgi:Tfp pilus assembly protein PilO